MRTYLYVDGENFAIRATHLDVELQKEPEQLSALKARANVGHAHWEGAYALNATSIWCPQAHRNAMDVLRTPNGILYYKDEIYWDSIGLFIALSAASMDHSAALPDIDRAYYYASASGRRIDQHARDLHTIGFTPNVSVKVRPDSFAKEMAVQGITVISRPKPVDIMIASQALDDCAANNFDRCIFVGGDEDYVPLLDAIRRRGKQVWLVAFERWLAKNQKLRFACDRFIAYDPVLAVRPLPPGNSAEDEP
jgi:uncharacterized LabA/DUF88 family protein